MAPSLKSMEVKPAGSIPVGQLLPLVMVSFQLGLPNLVRGSPATGVVEGAAVAVGPLVVAVGIGVALAALVAVGPVVAVAAGGWAVAAGGWVAAAVAAGGCVALAPP